MKICVTSNHRYPARKFPTACGGRAGARVVDLLARGLSELGHEVSYYLDEGSEEPPPANVAFVNEPRTDVDVMHVQHVHLGVPSDPSWPASVRTCHGDRALRWGLVVDDPIFVSRTHAASHGSTRYVHNGIDPGESLFSETKEPWFLFACNLHHAAGKGLPIALEACRRFGARLLVAGSASNDDTLRQVEEMCRGYDVELTGEISGWRKAELFASARALLFPTQMNESFGLVTAEALMSGTPVIASNHGACSELISGDVGFVCGDIEEYVRAMECAGSISPHACREKAMREFHYLRMAGDYVREYERQQRS